MAGANYEFIFVDMGHYGSEGDAGILHKSSLRKAMDTGKLNLPRQTTLTGSDVVCPYFFIGDQAFPLRSNLMRPYKGKNITYGQNIFNYRPFRARRVVKNAFGILANRFRILHRPLSASEKTNDYIVLAAIALHNFLIAKKCKVYCPDNFCDVEDTTNLQEPVDGLWRENAIPTQNLHPHRLIGSANFTRIAASIRDNLSQYFSTNVGQVSWQDAAVDRGYYIRVHADRESQGN